MSARRNRTRLFAHMPADGAFLRNWLSFLYSSHLFYLFLGVNLSEVSIEDLGWRRASKCVGASHEIHWLIHPHCDTNEVGDDDIAHMRPSLSSMWSILLGGPRLARLFRSPFSEEAAVFAEQPLSWCAIWFWYDAQESCCWAGCDDYRKNETLLGACL